jgi:NADP-dependent 3-hydroxy acid dehydrogenase YdfG
VPVASVEAVPFEAPAARSPAAEAFPELHIVPDDGGIATALAGLFSAANSSVTIGADIPARATDVIILRGLDRDGGAAQDARVLETFRQLRAFGQRHRRARSRLFLVMDTGGDFGLATSPGDRAVLGALAGLGKTAAREWPDARVRLIDLACAGTDPAVLARRVFDEMLHGGAEAEVGLASENRRVVPRLQTVARIAAPARSLTPGGAWVVSGGARGVTAPCLLALARRVPLKLALIGRTAIAQPEPADFRECRTDAALKQALLEAARRSGESLSPMELQRRARAVHGAREARATCETLRALGSEVRYLALDVGDARAVTTALDGLRAEWGPIRGVVHAAGVLADKAFHEKTDEQFQRVFGTKVDGFRALLAATQGDPLEAICCFSSVAARAGNAGQCDYAAANEALNKLCQAEQARRGATCRVRAINWGPWDGGMVGPALKSRFTAMGLRLIPVAAGAEIFADIVTGSLPVAVESVVGAVIEPATPSPSRTPAPAQSTT